MPNRTFRISDSIPVATMPLELKQREKHKFEITHGVCEREKKKKQKKKSNGGLGTSIIEKVNEIPGMFISTNETELIIGDPAG